MKKVVLKICISLLLLGALLLAAGAAWYDRYGEAAVKELIFENTGWQIDFASSSVSISHGFMVHVSFRDLTATKATDSINLSALDIELLPLDHFRIDHVALAGLSAERPVGGAKGSDHSSLMQLESFPAIDNVIIRDSVLRIPSAEGHVFENLQINSLILSQGGSHQLKVVGKIKTDMGPLDLDGMVSYSQEEYKWQGSLTSAQFSVPIIWLDPSQKTLDSWPQFKTGERYIDNVSFRAQVTASLSGDNWQLAIQNPNIESQYVQVKGGHISIVRIDGITHYDLEIQPRGHPQRIVSFLRQGWLSPTVYHWVRQNVEADAAFGLLTLKGRDEELSDFRLKLGLKKATVRFDDDWQPLTDFDCQLDMDQSSLTMSTARASFGILTVTELTFQVPNFDQAEAQLEAKIEGPWQGMSGLGDNFVANSAKKFDTKTLGLTAPLIAQVRASINLRGGEPDIHLDLVSDELSWLPSELDKLLPLKAEPHQLHLEIHSSPTVGFDIAGRLDRSLYFKAKGSGFDWRDIGVVVWSGAHSGSSIIRGKGLVNIPKLEGVIDFASLPQRLTIELQRLRLPKGPEHDDSVANDDRNSDYIPKWQNYPPLKISCDLCSYGDFVAKDLKFWTKSKGDRVQLEHFTFDGRGFKFATRGTLYQQQSPHQELNGTIKVTSGKQVAELLSLPKKVGGFKGDIKFSLNGAGLGLGLGENQLMAHFKLTDGRIRKTAGTWLIRLSQLLSLSLMDLVSKDLEVLNLEGDLTVSAGLMNLRKLKFVTPSNIAVGQGLIDLNHQTIDGKASVNLRLTHTVEAIALGLVNPFIGVGYWGIKPMENSYLDGLIGNSFRITGSLTDPKIKSGSK